MKLRLLLAGIVSLILVPIVDGEVIALNRTREARLHNQQLRDSEQSEKAKPNATMRVTVTGDATVPAQPDTAILDLAVVTQAPSASQAQAENATKSDRVVNALKTLLGPKAEIKTSGYSLQPQRVYKENQPPTITGYESRNTITVTISDLSKVGSVIDAATRAGANSVTNLQFTLRNDQPVRNQALAEATQEALSKARVIAQTLGGGVVRVVEVQESGAARPPIIYARQEYSAAARTDATTPIEVGTLDIKSHVQLVAEVEGGRQARFYRTRTPYAVGVECAFLRSHPAIKNVGDNALLYDTEQSSIPRDGLQGFPMIFAISKTSIRASMESITSRAAEAQLNSAALRDSQSESRQMKC